MGDQESSEHAADISQLSRGIVCVDQQSRRLVQCKEEAAAEIRAAKAANEAEWGTRVSDIKNDLREALAAVSMIASMPLAAVPESSAPVTDQSVVLTTEKNPELLPPGKTESASPEEAVAAAQALADRPPGSSPRELPAERYGASVAAVVRFLLYNLRVDTLTTFSLICWRTRAVFMTAFWALVHSHNNTTVRFAGALDK